MSFGYNRSLAHYGAPSFAPERHFHTPDGADHREMFEAGPGFEHYEHTSARRTINGHPVPVDAPLLPHSAMGSIASRPMLERPSLLDRTFGGYHGSSYYGSQMGGDMMRPSLYSRPSLLDRRYDDLALSRLPPPTLAAPLPLSSRPLSRYGGSYIAPEHHFHTLDGADHREAFEAAPGFEHYEHTSARRTINGQPVPVEAPPLGPSELAYGGMPGRTASF